MIEVFIQYETGSFKNAAEPDTSSATLRTLIEGVLGNRVRIGSLLPAAAAWDHIGARRDP